MATVVDRPPLQREAIIEAARELIKTDGLEALSLRRLAGGLGVTAPALYAHVADKQDLLRAVAEAEFDRLVESYDLFADATPIERVRAHARAYVRHAQQSPELFKVLFLFPPEVSGADFPPGIELPAATRAFSAASTAVQEAIDTGDIVSDDPLMVTMTLWAAAHGVATVLQVGLTNSPEMEESLIIEMTDRLLAGYRS